MACACAACARSSLTGTLPEEIFESCAALVQLNLSDNTLTGPVPEGLALLAQLRALHLGTNQFTGLLPVDVLLALGRPGTLRQLDLSNNALVVHAFEANLLTAGLPGGCALSFDPPDDAAAEAKLAPSQAAAAEVDFLDGLNALPQTPRAAEAKAGSAGEGKAAEATAEERAGEGQEEPDEAWAEGAAWGGGDWAEGWDDESGAPYWYSEATGESVWEDPNVGL